MAASPAEELLARLEAAAEAGLTKARLLPRGKARATAEAMLQELVAQRAVANLGSATQPRFVLAKHYRPLELAYAAIEKKATPGIAKAFTSRELAKGTRGGVADKAGEAIALLIGERKLVRLQRGKSTYYLHAASIEPLVAFSREPSSEPATTDRVSAQQVRASFLDLARETGFSDVLISALRDRSGAPLDALKQWLLEQSRAGQVLPTRGDWSLATEEARTAAIEIGGEPHLRVRLV